MIGRIAMAFFGEGPGQVTLSGETVNYTLNVNNSTEYLGYFTYIFNY